MIRVGIIGAGGNTISAHLPKLIEQSGVEIVSVANRTIASGKKVAKKFNIPLIFASLQAILVGTYSIFFAFIFEEINLSKIILEQYSIIYAGVFSGGIAFTLQMYAQKNIDEAPAAIIYSLEGVFAAVAGWIILNQILDLNNILDHIK